MMIKKAGLVAILVSLWGTAWGQDVENGRQLAALAACESCHTEEGGAKNAGGYPIETKYGVFFGTNITPDPETGIGNWTEAMFVQALKHGLSPEGRPYYPAFPFPSFSRFTDEDARDVFAYLATVEPVYKVNRSHALKRGVRNRGILRMWRLFSFRADTFAPREGESQSVSRGRYLVDVVGHCGECHTPRNSMGAMKTNRWLSGSDDGTGFAPNITPHQTGILNWSEEDIVGFLESGMKPDGDFSGGEMYRVVEECTSVLPEEERRAIAAWLKAVRPVQGKKD
jgi:mono/diheme cytochrome c family protein